MANDSTAPTTDTTSTSGVTQVDSAYLTNTENYIQGLIDQLTNQVIPGGTSTDSNGTGQRPALDGNLVVSAGSDSFQSAKILNKKLADVGTSVSTQLAWLKKLLSDMHTELGHTVQGFAQNESLNNDDVSTFLQDFPNTVGDLSGPPSSSPSTSSPSSSSPSTSSPPPSTSA